MLESRPSVDELVAQYASISKQAFKVIVGVFFGIALLSALARGLIRFKTQRCLSLDDYFLFIAAAFLVAATGLLYTIYDGFYLSIVIWKNPELFLQLTPQQVDQVLNTALRENIFLSLAWTATFCVKFSFLAFFRHMILRVERMQYYYWSVVILAVLSYMFLFSEAFILCHDFGSQSLKCLEPSKNSLYISLTGAITALDILTDILIVSIPIIILRRARIRTSQKVGLGVFLCLSIVMVALAVTRVSKIHGVAGIDVIWEFFWQYMETSVAVVMGSLTVVRSLLVYQPKGADQQHRAAVPRWVGDSHSRLRSLRRHSKRLELESQDGLPEIPGAVMTGLGTFIRRHNRDTSLDTQTTQTAILDYIIVRDDDSDYGISKPLVNLEGLPFEVDEANHELQSSQQPIQHSYQVEYHDQV